MFKARNKHTNKLTALKIVIPTDEDEGVKPPSPSYQYYPPNFFSLGECWFFSCYSYRLVSYFQLPFTAVREIKYLQTLSDNPNIIKLEGTFFSPGTCINSKS